MALLESDPLDILLDDDGDIIVDPVRGITFVSGLAGVAQLVRIAIRLFRGEWFLDLDAGVPYFQTILGKKYDAATLRAELVKAVVDVPGVAEILNITLEFDGATREASVSLALRTEFGDTVVELELTHA